MTEQDTTLNAVAATAEPIDTPCKSKRSRQQAAEDAMDSLNPEDALLSTSPDSANGEQLAAGADLCHCAAASSCVTLQHMVECFKGGISEEQAWAIMYRFALFLQRHAAGVGIGGKQQQHRPAHGFRPQQLPESMDDLCLHRDGSVHLRCRTTTMTTTSTTTAVQAFEDDDQHHAPRAFVSAKKMIQKLGVIVFTALDYNFSADEQCQLSPELEDLLTCMTADEINDSDIDSEDCNDDCIDEGIDEGCKRWDDESEDGKYNETKEFDYILEACKNHIKPLAPDDHYRAVCRALVTEATELRLFLQHVFNNGAEVLPADSETSQQELAKLGFNDWTRFWVQVIEELRRGVRLKKSNYSRTPTEYQLTPYEILMEDIRSKKYQLRKVMVNGDIPPRVKKDAHALILEFIRSRPPLKKASERKLPPPRQRTPSPREQLMDSIRKGRKLKHITPPPQPRLKDRLLPPPTAAADPHIKTVTALPSTSASSSAATAATAKMSIIEHSEVPRSKQRLIKVDFSLLQDDDNFFDELSNSSSTTTNSTTIGNCSQPQMPPYPIAGYMASGAKSGKAQPTGAAPAPVSGSQEQHQTATLRSTRRTILNLFVLTIFILTKFPRYLIIFPYFFLLLFLLMSNIF